MPSAYITTSSSSTSLPRLSYPASSSASRAMSSTRAHASRSPIARYECSTVTIAAPISTSDIISIDAPSRARTVSFICRS